MEKKILLIFLIVLICVFGNNNCNKGIVEVEILNLDLIFFIVVLMIDGDGILNYFKYYERRIVFFCSLELWLLDYVFEVK